MHRAWFFFFGVLASAVIFAAAWNRQDDAGGRFITTAGTTHTSGWTITVAPDEKHQTLNVGALQTSPMWVTQPGWFLFLENDTRCWAFNGDDILLLYVADPGDSITAFSLDTAPIPPPEAVVRRIGQQRVDAIAAAARSARERLGIAPAR